MNKKLLQISIPDDVRFADLKLRRHKNGDLSFDWSPILKICQASGIDPGLMKTGPEENVSGLVVAWYVAHRDDGGAPDQAAEEIMREVLAEEIAGQKFSYPPGSA